MPISGNFLPDTDAARSLGAPAARWKAVVSSLSDGQTEVPASALVESTGAVPVHNVDPAAHGQTAAGRAILTAPTAFDARTNALGFGAAGDVRVTFTVDNSRADDPTAGRFQTLAAAVAWVQGMAINAPVTINLADNQTHLVTEWIQWRATTRLLIVGGGANTVLLGQMPSASALARAVFRLSDYPYMGLSIHLRNVKLAKSADTPDLTLAVLGGGASLNVGGLTLAAGCTVCRNYHATIDAGATQVSITTTLTLEGAPPAGQPLIQADRISFASAGAMDLGGYVVDTLFKAKDIDLTGTTALTVNNAGGVVKAWDAGPDGRVRNVAAIPAALRNLAANVPTYAAGVTQPIYRLS